MPGWFNKAQRPPLEELPDVLRELVNEVRQERGELESLLARASAAAHNAASHADGLTDLDERAKKLSSQIGTAEQRIERLTGIGDRVEEIRVRAEEVERSQDQSQSHVAALKVEMASVETSVREVRDVQKQAGELRLDLAALMGEKGSVRELENTTESLRAEVEGLVQSVAQVSERERELRKSHDGTILRFADMKDSASELAQELQSSSGRLAKLQSTFGQLSKVEEVAARAEQQLQSLNALGDHVTQKLHSLENQGEVVDRAAAQAARLDDLVWEIDGRLKKVQKDGKQISQDSKDAQDTAVAVGRDRGATQ